MIQSKLVANSPWPLLMFAVAGGWWLLMQNHLSTSGSVHTHALSNVFWMWVLMTLVMMSTTAVPVLKSLHSITQNATQLIWWAFVFGYLVIWFGFALVASSLQLMIGELNLLDAHTGLNKSLSAGLLLIAGLYQFSSLKQRCQSECLAPMQFFLRHWRDGVSGGLKMGLRHGVTCVGCCWALMLLAFVGGLTNIWFMVLSAVVMAVEKFPVVGRRLTAPLGVLIIIWGVAVFVSLFSGVGGVHSHLNP
jgi:predicted metal-binding membrane protein